MAGTNFKVKNGLEIQSGTVIAGGGAGTSGQVLSSTGTGVQWVNAATGTGDVVGPASATDNAVVRFDGTTGKLIQDSTVTLSDTGVLTVPELSTTSITSTGNNPIIIAPDGTGDVHLNADSVRIGDNNTDATLITRGTGDLLLTTNEGSATEGIIRIYDGANGNITLTPNGTGQVQVGSDQVVTLTASQTLTNKSLSGSSNTFTNIPNSATTATSANTASAIVARDASGNFSAGTITATLSGNATNVTGTVAVANGGTGLTSLTAGRIPYGSGTSAFGSSANLFWDSTNSRLGVGTASPAAPIHIQRSDDGLIGIFRGTSNAQLLLSVASGNLVYDSSNGNGFHVFQQNTTERMRIAAGQLILGNGDTSATPFTSTLRGTDGSGTDIAGASLTIQGGRGTGTGAGGSLVFNTAPAAGTTGSSLNAQSERMRITSAGNVGIGTASPAEKLHIEGNLYFGTTSRTIAQGGSANMVLQVNTGQFVFVSANGATERMRINASGEIVLGNGNTSPTPTNATLRGTDGTGTDIAGASLTIQAGRGTGTGAGGSLLFFTAAASGTTGSTLNTATEKMRLNAAGILGLGVTPQSWNSIFKAIQIGGSNYYSIASQNSGSSYGSILWNAYGTGDETFAYNKTGDNATRFAQQYDFRWYLAPSGTAGNTITFTQAMTLDASGNLGLNITPRPFNSIFKALQIGSLNYYSIASQNSGSAYGSILWNAYGTGDEAFAYNKTGDKATRFAQQYDFKWFTAPSGTAGSAITFTQVMTLDNSGNLGIGTASPINKLTILGSTAASGELGSFAITGSTTAKRLAFGVDSTATMYGWIQSVESGIGFRDIALQPLGGNLGVGTASPDAKLSVNGVGSFGAGTAALPSIAQFGDLDTGRWSPAANTLAWSTSGTERMRITSGGELLIGNTTGTEKLTVTGKIKASDVLLGNNGTKGYGAITTTTSTSTPTGGASGDFTLIY